MTIVYSSATHNQSAPGAPRMRFQVRDQVILNAIHEYGGVLAKRHLQQMFWPNRTRRAMERRLAKLYRNGYLAWPTRQQWRSHPIPEPICWLGWKAALWLASANNTAVVPLQDANENQQRKLERAIRTAGLHWLREPRWIQLDHDLAVVDFRLLLENSLRENRSLRMSKWLNEYVFRSNMDVVEFDAEDPGGSIRRMRKGVCPDAFFMLEDENRRAGGQPFRARFLLELDRATHDNPSFGLEKALPGAVYIQSPAYRRRFGQNSGRWLVVTTAGDRRIGNLMRQTEARVPQHANLFSFTTLELLNTGNALTSKVWFHLGSSQPSALMPDM